MGNSLVSAVVPAYRAADFIERCLRSVLDQTYESVELIIVNDGSPDTAELERVLEPYRDRLTYLVQENGGAASARNAGIRAAHGEFIAFLDADDWWDPHFLEHQIQLIGQSPEADLVYSNGWLSGRRWVEGQVVSDGAFAVEEVTALDLIRADAVVITSSVVVRHSVLTRVGLFDVDLRPGEDFDLWLRIALSGGLIRRTSRPLMHRLLRDDSVSADSEGILRGMIQAYRNAAEQTSSENLRSEIADQIRLREADIALLRARRRLQQRHYVEAKRLLSEANVVIGSRRLALIGLLLRIAPGFVRTIYMSRRALLPKYASDR